MLVYKLIELAYSKTYRCLPLFFLLTRLARVQIKYQLVHKVETITNNDQRQLFS